MTESEGTGERHHLGGTRSLGFVILSVSDTHTEEDDPSGHLAIERMESGKHHLVRYHLVANSVADVRDALEPLLDDRAVEVVVTVGGTGASSRDLTVNALEAMGGRLLPGFGETYRSISFGEVGPLATLSRAGLYLLKQKPVFALPGSERAVRMAIDRLILPSVQHLVEELER